jgi:hypothetical protein
MSKLARIRGRDPILQKVVFEVRYRYGFTYLDTCGRTINTIMREYPEWVLRSESASPQNAPLLSLRNSCVFNFSALKYDLSVEHAPDKEPISDEDADTFSSQAEYIHAIVSESLGLGEFTRIGFRAWYLFSCSDELDGERWLRDLGCYRVEDKLVTAFGAEIEASSLSVLIPGEDRKFRIAFNGVERQAQIDFGQGILNVRPHDLDTGQDKFLKEQIKVKKRMRQTPEFAAMIDVDSFQENPKVIAPASFIETSSERILAALTKATT